MAVSTRAFSSNNPFRSSVVKSQDFDIELYNTDRSSFLYSHVTTSDQSLAPSVRSSLYSSSAPKAGTNPFFDSSERSQRAASHREDFRRASHSHGREGVPVARQISRKSPPLESAPAPRQASNSSGASGPVLKPLVRTRAKRSTSDSSVVDAKGSVPVREHYESGERKSSSRSREAHSHHRSSRDKDSRESSSREHSSKERSSKERSSKDRSSKERSSKERSSKSRSKKKAPPLDTIDKLDVTGMFGPGSFHHDGPFDACNPHRNKRNNNKAPMMAFPVDGANMKLAGKDTTRSAYATENFIFGHEEVINGSDSVRLMKNNNHSSSSLQPNFDPASNAKPVHGDTTMGLGSSTFLDGAPAPKVAVTRNEEAAGATGLGRKKSLVQKLRGATSQAPQIDRAAKSPVSRQLTPPVTKSSTLLASTEGDIERSVSSDSATPRAITFASEERKMSAGAASGPSNSNGSGLLRRVRSLKVGSRKKEQVA